MRTRTITPARLPLLMLLFLIAIAAIGSLTFKEYLPTLQNDAWTALTPWLRTDHSAPPREFTNSVQPTLDSAAYHITALPHTYAAEPTQFSATNLAQNLRAHFSADGVDMLPAMAQTDDWRWRMAFVAYGYGSMMHPVATTDIVVTDNRISYLRGNVTEWYVNGPDGVKQSFTITAPPSHIDRAKEPLYVDLSVSSDLTAVLAHDGQSMAFMNAEHQPVVTYDSLHVFDADGQKLPAYMTLRQNRDVPDGTVFLRITVDTTAAHYPVTIDPLVATDTRLVASGVTAGDQFGWAVALSGNTAIIGAPAQDMVGENSGVAYVFIQSGDRWVQQARIFPRDSAEGDAFGSSVAIDGNTALVGAIGDNGSSGAVYVFVRNGTIWTQQAKLVAADGGITAQFGKSIALDRDTALIGAHFDSNEAGNLAGAAYVFVRAGSRWAQQAKLIGSDTIDSDLFGWSVALEGNTALIGSLFNTGSIFSSGSVYAFNRVGGGWSEQAKLITNDSDVFDQFGSAIALSGNVAAIGAPTHDGTSADSGAVYLFELRNGMWGSQTKLVVSDSTLASQFGSAVSLLNNTVLVGAPAPQATGISYVFERNGASWNQQTRLVPGDGVATDQFGKSVALNEVAALIGAPFNDKQGTNAGAAYIFPNVTTGTIIIVKEADSADTTQFDFTGDLGTFSLRAGQGQTFEDIPTGVYGVMEVLPSGWDLESVVCTGGDSQPLPDGRTILLDTEETITCTFRNVPQPGSIRIVKETGAANGPLFSFTGDLGTFDLPAGGSRLFANLMPGIYTVDELVPANWNLDQVVCEGGDSSRSGSGVRINLAAGADVTCRFINVRVSQQTGSIRVVKEADPVDGTVFNFAGDLGAFRLTAGDSTTFADLRPGIYRITEQVPAGWVLDDAVCVGGNSTTVRNGVDVVVSAGATLTCTFTNEQASPSQGTITIVKEADGPDDTVFDFAGDLESFNLEAGDRRVFENLAAGTYSVTELVPAGWTLTDIACKLDTTSETTIDLDAATVSIILGADDAVTCTFTNEEEDPTAVTLVSFTADIHDDGQVILNWKTATEIDNAGFNLYRATDPRGPWTQINGSLIPAQGDMVTGANYRFEDNPGSGTFYYRLEDVDFNGVSTFHGPVQATVQTGTAAVRDLPHVYLPLIKAN